MSAHETRVVDAPVIGWQVHCLDCGFLREGRVYKVRKYAQGIAEKHTQAHGPEQIYARHG